LRCPFFIFAHGYVEKESYELYYGIAFQNLIEFTD